MIAYILLGISGTAVIIGILLWIFGKNERMGDWLCDVVVGYGKAKTTAVVMTIVGTFFAVIISLITISSIKQYKKEIYTFKQQKEYIENVVPTLPQSDNYAITHKRIEQNEWLYEIQFKYQNYKFWHLIPDEVMELTPIE